MHLRGSAARGRSPQRQYRKIVKEILGRGRSGIHHKRYRGIPAACPARVDPVMRLRGNILLLVCACACSGKQLSPDEAKAIDAYYARIVDVEARFMSCGGVAPEFAASWVERCAWSVGFDPQAAAAEAKAEIAAGHTRFDPARAASCLDGLQLDPATCWGENAPFVQGRWPQEPLSMVLEPPPIFGGAQKPLPADCEAVFSGLVPDGAQCDDWRDCSSHICAPEQGSPRPVCRPAAREGEQCGGGCSAGLSCAGYQTCSPVHHAGDSCANEFDCELGLACVNGSCMNGDVGQPCDSYPIVDCKSALLCDRAALPSNCQLPPVQYNCAQTALDPACVGNQICMGPADHGTCGIPQDVGGPCLVGLPGLAAGCYAGLICDPAKAKCAFPPKAGRPCVDGICDAFTAFCTNGSCKAQLGAGEHCDDQRDMCQAPTVCFGGVCQINPIDPGFAPPRPCALR